VATTTHAPVAIARKANCRARYRPPTQTIRVGDGRNTDMASGSLFIAGAQHHAAAITGRAHRVQHLRRHQETPARSPAWLRASSSRPLMPHRPTGVSRLDRPPGAHATAVSETFRAVGHAMQELVCVRQLGPVVRALTRTRPRNPTWPSSPPGDTDIATVEDSARIPVNALMLLTFRPFGQCVIA